MGVDFAAEGLLDGLDGDERAARLELLERLRSEGATVDELRSAVADGLLVFLLAERLIDGPPRHTSRDVAREAGLPLAKLEAMRRAHGLPVPEPDAIALTDLDVEAIRTAGAFRAAGVTDEQMLRAIRVFGRGMAQAAETLRAIGLELALEPGSSEAELAQRFAERSAAVAPLLGPLLDCALELHDAAADESDELPALRVGVAHGPAVARAGDWYGRPVNLANRITGIARPGSVLATREVRDAAPEGYRWSAAGRRSLRGIDGQVALYRARRADGESAGYS